MTAAPVKRRELAKTLDLEAELRPLKDFQRRTVDHVVRRMYDDPDPTTRFLVADEVGLGKTMVARGVIAHAIDRLRGKVARIDVVYVCSNAAIAQQNMNRLNVLSAAEMALATRLTLLPAKVRSLDANDVNFVSFTPGTTFDLKSRGGTKEERAVLYHLLAGHLELGATPLRNLLQQSVGFQSWVDTIAAVDRAALSDELGAEFRRRLEASTELLARVREGCDRNKRWKENIPSEDWNLALRIVGELRSLLARVCIHALEPDLVILDEFQRFKDLLDGESEAAELAQALFSYPGVRVLLLSATPYRMVTLGHETEEDHHADFIRTFRFLSDDQLATDALKSDLVAYRHGLLGTHARSEEILVESRRAIEGRLRRYMSRTERVSSTDRRDAMTVDVPIACPLRAEDLPQALVADGVSRALGAGDAIEYWKSAPYLLGFMERYQLKDRLKKVADDVPEKAIDALRAGADATLRAESIRRYEDVPYANARLRALASSTIDAGQWRLLWLPPAMPYIAPTERYQGLGASAYTKSLVFSSWSVVPDVIASLLSFHAERLAVGAAGVRAGYDEHPRARRPLLTFRLDAEKRPTGMPVLGLLYPSVTLAAHLDPLDIALDEGDGEPAPLEAVRTRVVTRIRPLVARITEGAPADGPNDQRWYWAAPALLDARHHPEVVAWIETGLRGLYRDEAEALDGMEDDRETAYDRHVEELLRVVRREERLGRPPADLAEVVADLALASPAVCAARAIRRVAGVTVPSDRAVLDAAARVARGFRVLFNVPEAMELLLAGREEDDERAPYWRSVLLYCVDGNLQAVLDEYAHLLVESEGQMGHAPASIAATLATVMQRALSPRTSSLSVDEIRARPRKAAIDITSFRIRCRFALRYGQLRSDADKELARAEVVRDAFNSPFRPFVLASTSVGQEGLDFHRYCHAVVHWNLPSNPVDLEQREGRVHRYKGHAVRRNLAMAYGLRALRRSWQGDGDPWARLFELAAADRPAGRSELVPYWIFETEGGARIERRVPLLPMSREHDQFERLKKSLALYRLVFGQPRQEDLLAYLGEHADARELDRFKISLEPDL